MSTTKEALQEAHAIIREAQRDRVRSKRTRQAEDKQSRRAKRHAVATKALRRAAQDAALYEAELDEARRELAQLGLYV